MRRFFLLAALVLLVATAAFAATPAFITGDLGNVGVSDQGGIKAASVDETNGRWGQAAEHFMVSHVDLYQGRGTEQFTATQVRHDELGQVHIRLQEYVHGLPVVGADSVLHVEKATGKAMILNGQFVRDENLATEPMVAAWDAIDEAAREAHVRSYDPLDAPELTYLVNDKGNVFLAWAATIHYVNRQGDQIDRIFADATNATLVGRHPKIYRALNRAIYNANHGTTLPGTLMFSEGGSSTDTTAQAAYNNAGSTYNFYKNKFNRDSYDNAGAQIKSSVHYSTNYNNAFWNGSQMVYGDGDGTTFAPFAKSLDVVAHELTHAVTERTANLNYSNESGALNEATSDILGNSTEAYTTNAGTPNSNTWKVGEDIYTPSTAGDALRYMNNPTQDGSSKDYYPERYTGTSDNGGVHSNSGIANLAYYLMTMGGSHPRSKTTVVVPALSSTSSTSLDMAAKIWYRALTVYMTSSTNFQGARNATAQAAADLYGGTTGTAYNSVQKAWDCVAVPGGTGGGGGGVVTLSNGQTVSNISGATGSWLYYKITVPASQTSLVIKISGGTGDCDLYVKRGAQPTSTSYDYRPYLSGNNETVSVTNPVAADYYIGLNGYAAYSGVSLNATYSASGGGGTCTTYTGSLSGTGASQIQPNGTYYQSTVSGTHSGKLTGPASGADFDLYLYKWNGSAWASVASGTGSTASENVTYSGTSGYYEWKVLSYSGSGSYSLCISHP